MMKIDFSIRKISVYQFILKVFLKRNILKRKHNLIKELMSMDKEGYWTVGCFGLSRIA